METTPNFEKKKGFSQSHFIGCFKMIDSPVDCFSGNIIHRQNVLCDKLRLSEFPIIRAENVSGIKNTGKGISSLLVAVTVWSPGCSRMTVLNLLLG
jgi:hypothetical protein